MLKQSELRKVNKSHQFFVLIRRFLSQCRANANVGFGDNFGGSAGFQAGPIGGSISAGVNNNLLMTVIVGLGLLSFLNIIATVATPFLGAFFGGDDEGDSGEEKTGDDARRYQRNLRFLTDNVLNAIESFGDKHK